MAFICAHDRVKNILPTLIHVVFRPDAHCFKPLLRPDDMFQGMTKFFSQLAMSDKHKSDHVALRSIIQSRGTPVIASQ